MAVTKAASEDFMSAAPRPYSTPSRIVGAKGGEDHALSGPGGTTSVWPAKHSTGAAMPRRAHRLQTPPLSMRSRRKPSGARREATSSRQPASSGVTEGRAMSSQASARVEELEGLVCMGEGGRAGA